MKEKLRIAWKAIQKYHFWILVVLVLIIGMTAWMTATAELAKQYESRKQKLSSDLKAVRTITRETDPPNDKVVSAIEQEHAQLKENVLEAWEVLYREQKAKNPWPRVLGEEFLAMIEAIGPNDEIPVRFRDTYLYFIRDHFPQLLKLIDVRRPKLPEGSEGRVEAGMGGEGMPGMGGGRGSEGVEMVGKVEWDPADRQRIIDRFDWQTRPETIQIRLAQEDLWVYEALLRIIKNTNEGATSFYNAAVKRIDALLIGQDAAQLLNKAKDPFANAPGESGGAAGSEMGMMEPGMEAGMMAPEEMMEGGPGGMGAEKKESIAAELLDGRYVTETGVPLPYGTKHPFAEFKMMPIQMDLVMDQRRVPELLVECANSSMPVEVHEVSINPGKSGSLNMSQMARSGRSSRRRPSSRSGMMEMEYMGGEMGMAGGRELGGDSELVMGEFDVSVRIQGIIYIYNPPDRDKLGTGAGTEEAPVEPETAVQPPVEAPAAPAEPAAPPETPPAGPGAAEPPAAEVESPAAAPPEPAAPAAPEAPAGAPAAEPGPVGADGAGDASGPVGAEAQP